ncbi:peptidylprolyl isomerase [Pseudarthrobacter enclensis]|uniref:peptidylprolyl isomerase n=1 Tax=Pseudarthrobacter enclensis TaxID=993070 RepID=A0A0V8ISV5_9MICC|nr:peptidylprolyl isomerase [Pseudarthrobacter enclensis]KSU77838.1 cyclophilin [Pseudarthrobacter enclensis]BCW19302.1 putative peptidyl-prolyl cis-trans isomerase B [Arthrobacter sp. NtRootA9]SCB95098.1 peptidyl-prolyl cis-trans isomerase B (cyclophilin B) [Pseudarthrobacter enclensis]
MAASSRSAREAKRHIQQMEAKRELRRDQEKRRKRDNLIAAGAGTAAVALAVVLQLTAFAGNPTEDEFAAAEAGLTSPSASATPSAQATNGPNIPSADTAAGKTFTGELVLNGKPLGVELDGTAAPQAAAVFKSLSDEGFYKGKSCHRLTTADAFGVLQCGSANGDGQGNPDYTWGPLENTPQDNKYPAGTIAVARTGNNAYGNGTQFFIVYKDTTIPADTAGGYTVVGKVTSGLDVVSGIAAAGITPGSSDTDGAPVEPVTIDSFSLK